MDVKAFSLSIITFLFRGINYLYVVYKMKCLHHITQLLLHVTKQEITVLISEGGKWMEWTLLGLLCLVLFRLKQLNWSRWVLPQQQNSISEGQKSSRSPLGPKNLINCFKVVILVLYWLTFHMFFPQWT